ncbi:hypothetical protein SESBI_11901 [Sesbania bispinosa]|nr:hypothetical protein SESBI_11901 [Sesbania bispinosa]
MNGCGGEARDEPGGGAEEERAHDDGLRNHDDAARGERGILHGGNGMAGGSTDLAAGRRKTHQLRMNQVDHECYYPTGRVMACISWFGHAI